METECRFCGYDNPKHTRDFGEVWFAPRIHHGLGLPGVCLACLQTLTPLGWVLFS